MNRNGEPSKYLAFLAGIKDPEGSYSLRILLHFCTACLLERRGVAAPQAQAEENSVLSVMRLFPGHGRI